MKLSKKVYRFQEGGMAPAEEGMAPEGAGMAPEGAAPEGGAPADQMMQQIGAMADEIIQQMGPDAAAMLAQAIMERLQGGGEQLPPAEQQPTFQRRGGVLLRTK